MDLERLEKALLLRLTRDTGRLLSPWRSLDMRRLGRVMLHAVLVGAMAGGIACVFFWALQFTEWLLLGQAARYQPALAAGELAITPPAAEGPPRLWLLAVLPALGGLACGFITRRFAPETAGAGGSAFIDAFHNEKGAMRGRVALIKPITTCLTIGSGGSAGREGAIMQICASTGASLSRWLKLDDHERRILVVAAAAAGTGAILRTPLGAALFAVEVLYRDDFESDAIVPSILASVTGYSIFTTVFGQGHLFITDPSYPFHVLALPLYAVMAVGLSLFAASFVQFGDWVRRSFAGLQRVPVWLHPALGGLALGLIGLLVPEALGTGYGLVQGAIMGDEWIAAGRGGYLALLGLAAVKIVATELTVKSGGSGGEFGPSLVIGGLVGGAFGLMFHAVFPQLVPQPGAFALVGMGAFIGGIAHVPISSLIMVCEMTGSYDLLVPLMLAESVTFVLLRGTKLYDYQVPGRVDSPAHRDEITIDILEAIRARDVFEVGEEMPSVKPGDSLDHVLEVISSADHPGIVVRDEGDAIVGMISLDAVQGSILEEGLGGLLVAADVMSQPELVRLDQDLHEVLHAFLVTGMSVLPVVDPDEGDALVGVVTQLDVTRAYDGAVEERLRSSARSTGFA